MYMFFGTGNQNVRSILTPEVELMVFLRMRSDKIAKRPSKCRLWATIPDIYVFGHGKSESEVHFVTGSRINGVSAHAQ